MPYYANGTGRDLYILDLIRGGADHGQTRFNRPVAFYQQKRSNDRNVLPQFAESSRYRVGPFEGSLPTLLSDASTLSSFYLVNKKPERVVPLEDMRRLQESLHQGEEGKKKRCIVASQRELNQRMARPRSRDLTSMRVGSRDRLYRNFNSSRRSLNLSLTEL
eukprot:g5720.t1